MSRGSAYVIVLGAFGVLLAACAISSRGLPDPATAPSSRPTTTAAVAAMCDPAALRLGYGPPPSMQTGEHAVLYTLRNEASRSCILVGYPTVTLFDVAGTALPFRYIDGRGRYVTNASPAPVALLPGTQAYFFVAKYRCDIGDLSAAATIRITLPLGGAGLTGPVWVDESGAGTLSYCRGGANDPGQIIGVSPFESTALAATAWPSG